MDELLLKEAVNNIHLTPQQKERILKGCERNMLPKNRRPYWFGAACACILCAAGVLLWQSSGLQSEKTAGSSVADSEILDMNNKEYGNVDGLNGSGTQNEMAMEDIICVNEISEERDTDYSRMPYGEDEYERSTWNWEQVEEYYGRSLSIEPLPEGLSAHPMAGKQQIIRERATGKIVEDTVWLEYWNDWQDYENGGARRMVTEGGKGFTVLVSKIGIVDCAIPVWADEPQTSRIHGTEVLIGHQIIGTLYNENHEPAFEYDVYRAWFTYDGAEYEVTADALTLEEVVEIVKALIPA